MGFKILNLRTFTVLICVLLPVSIIAEQLPPKLLKYCSGVGELSEKIMRLRQYGDNPTPILLAAQGSKFGSQINSLVLDAYEKDRWATAESINRQIEDFREKAEIECLESKYDFPRKTSLTMDNVKYCSEAGLFAHLTMSFRQAGIPPSETIEASADDLSEFPDWQSIIRQAYEVPRRASSDNRTYEIENFVTDIEVQCLVENE